MDRQLLIQFLLDANAAGYAAGKEKQWIKERDGSTTIPFEKGDFRMHDNFFGGEPYGGRLVVFYKGKPVWIMVYYGFIVQGVEVNPVYAMLREALMNMPADAPFRGPKFIRNNGYEYENSWEGDVFSYHGHELIRSRKNIVYEAYYRGGVVDQQEGV